MNDGLKADLKILMGGMKRTVAKHKKQAGESLVEGKQHMSFEVYNLMCEILSKGANTNNSEYLFAHCYLVLEWNLMARSENVQSCHVNHIAWDNDSLLFYFPISKSNQGGENSHVPWHVYSNPFQPHLCPVLTLAKYLFSQSGILAVGDRLFPGKHQYDRFIKVFHRIIKVHEAEFRRFGVECGDLGSHSTRKGAITHVSSGCTVSPPMASICLRACWSMGPIKDRYIHYEKAGDQFVGRSVTTISSMTKEFAVSPCYFDTTREDGSVDTVLDGKINQIIKTYLVSRTEQANPSVLLLMRFLFASICFHYDYLLQNECAMSPLRSSAVLHAASANLDVTGCACIKFPWNKTLQTPQVTGIPPHVVLQAEMESLQQKMEQTKNDIVREMGLELDRRHIGGDAFQGTRLLDQVTKVHDQMTDMLNRHQNGPVGGRGGVRRR